MTTTAENQIPSLVAFLSREHELTTKAPIKLRFSTIDGIRENKTFKTLEGARKAAVLRVGEHPELGHAYAVSSDGVVKVEVRQGATLAELFPAPQDEKFWTVCGVSFNTFAAASKDREHLRAIGEPDSNCQIQEWDVAEVYGAAP